MVRVPPRLGFSWAAAKSILVPRVAAPTAPSFSSVRLSALLSIFPPGRGTPPWGGKPEPGLFSSQPLDRSTRPPATVGRADETGAARVGEGPATRCVSGGHAGP